MRSIFSIFLLFLAAPVQAQPVVTAGHQQCASHADCTLISLTCGNACASVPVSLQGKAALEPDLRNQCGGTLPEEIDMICHMHPPMGAACVNNRCTIDYAFENHGEPADYQKKANNPQSDPQDTPPID